MGPSHNVFSLSQLHCDNAKKTIAAKSSFFSVFFFSRSLWWFVQISFTLCLEFFAVQHHLKITSSCPFTESLQISLTNRSFANASNDRHQPPPGRSPSALTAGGFKGPSSTSLFRCHGRSWGRQIPTAGSGSEKGWVGRVFFVEKLGLKSW